MRRSPLRRRRPMPRRRSAPMWDAQQWEHASSVMWRRQRGRCDWCGQPLRGDAARHHRQRRRDGGDTFPNVVLLHPHCHSHVHAYPRDARGRGFIVPTWDDPEHVPLDVAGTTGQGSFWLHPGGSRQPLP